MFYTVLFMNPVDSAKSGSKGLVYYALAWNSILKLLINVSE